MFNKWYYLNKVRQSKKTQIIMTFEYDGVHVYDMFNFVDNFHQDYDISYFYDISAGIL